MIWCIISEKKLTLRRYSLDPERPCFSSSFLRSCELFPLILSPISPASVSCCLNRFCGLSPVSLSAVSGILLKKKEKKDINIWMFCTFERMTHTVWCTWRKEVSNSALWVNRQFSSKMKRTKQAKVLRIIQNFGWWKKRVAQSTVICIFKWKFWVGELSGPCSWLTLKNGYHAHKYWGNCLSKSRISACRRKHAGLHCTRSC